MTCTEKVAKRRCAVYCVCFKFSLLARWHQCLWFKKWEVWRDRVGV